MTEYTIIARDHSVKSTVPHEFENKYFHFEPVLTTPDGRYIFAPMSHLTNASGTGKTRSAIELGRVSNCVYLKFGGNNGLNESIVGRMLVKHFKAMQDRPLHRIYATHTLHVVPQRILFICGLENDRGNLADEYIHVEKVLAKYYGCAMNESP